MRFQAQPRTGATVVESAVVYPLVFLFTVGFIVGTMGIFRYQEVATLAREACRYASVHGADYAKDNNMTVPSPTDIHNEAVLPRVVGLDPAQIKTTITYDKSNAPYHSKIVNNEVVFVQNTVTVVVSYTWIPEAFLGGLTLTSSCSMPMSY